MSISSRINEMSTHIEQAYDELQGLGADLTGIDKNIDNIASVLDDIYDDLPKVTGSGTSITLDDTRKGRLESTLSGNTSQFTTTGKNFYSTSMLPITQYGITISKNANGDIVLNGTPNYSEGFKTFYTGDVITVEAGTYTLSVANKIAGVGCVVGGFNGGCNLTLSDTVTSKSAYADTPQNVNPAINIRYDVGTLTNFVLNPQMEKSSSATTYEPFTNGASPNPDYPQEVNVVSGDNEINVCGKNLLENQYLPIPSADNTATYEVKNAYLSQGTYTLATTDNSTFGNTVYIKLFKEDKQVVKESGHLSTSNGNYSTNTYNYFIGTANNLTYIQFTIDDNYYARIGLLNSNNTKEVMLVKGTEIVRTYEPYSSNSYPINLGVENLLDLTSLNPNQVGQQVSNIQENSFIMSGTAVWGNEYFFYENTNKNTTYTASCKYLSSLARKSGLSIYGTNETTGENLTTINSLLVDIPANVETPVTNTFNSGNYDYIVFRYWNNATATALSSRVDLYVKEVQLEKGTKANSYTPYGTTPIELCKIGDYQDYFYKDNGKWYLHKEIGKVVLNGSEDWNADGGTQGTDYRHNILRSRLDIPNPIGINNTYLSNYFIAHTINNDVGVLGEFYCNANWFIFLDKNKVYDLDQWKNWLSTHNVVVYYVLATPVNTALEDM